MSELLMELGNNIKQARTAKNMSQTLLAGLADVNITTIDLIEKGKRNVTFINLVKIAKVLEINLSDLIPKNI